MNSQTGRRAVKRGLRGGVARGFGAGLAGLGPLGLAAAAPSPPISYPQTQSSSLLSPAAGST